MHHLLDSHADLDVFPVENCIVRDGLFAIKLPNARRRTLSPLIRKIRAGDFEDAVTYMINHEKIGLPLKESINLSGSTGDQTVSQKFDVKVFRRKLLESMIGLDVADKSSLVLRLYEAYHMAYSAAIGTPEDCNEKILVNKCPEAGLIIDFCLKNLEDVKIIHIIRDPRDVIASFKAELSINMYHPFFRLLTRLNLLKNSYNCFCEYQDDERVLCVRYEDLVVEPEKVMLAVAHHIDVPMSATLIQPTINGVPWKGNSSNVTNRKMNYGITVDLKKYLKKLNHNEINFIERYIKTESEIVGYEHRIVKSSIKIYLSMVKYIIISLIHIPTYRFMFKRKLKKYLNV